ncbi:GTPase-associated system all-helical protein GASH [Sphingobacterium siyangense]|uniref:GTPase-associated system all-helical protein GASH n=1 Tax=Sphingobacterium siyangense TaxID=459529 RepID=UPI002FDEDBB9
MAETLLQNFLNRQFIKTAEAENITGLLKAVTALKKILSTKRSLITNYVLVALDPQINENDPVVHDVERLIIKNWSTFKNSTSTKDKATTYVRVVILQALADLSKDEIIGALIWQSGRNVISYYKVQKERDVLVKLLEDIGTEYEINSRKYWTVNLPTIKELKDFSMSLPTIKGGLLDEDEMVKVLKTGAIHRGWKDQAGVGGFGENPSYASNGNWEWANFFSQKVGTDLTALLNNARASQVQSLNSFGEGIEHSINEYFSQVSSFFTQIASSVGASTEANSKRSNLLWWKQTLYSPLLDNSYRNESLIASAIAMAFDISQLVGNLYPESSNYLLREALFDVHGGLVNKEEKFDHWINLMKDDQTICESLLAPFIDGSEGRKPLLIALADLLGSSDHSFSAMTGIDVSEKISLSDFTVWILNDLQAKKISQIK